MLVSHGSQGHFKLVKMDLPPSALERMYAYDIIDTVEMISILIGILASQPVWPPSLYIDLEGINLSRWGYISILQIHVAPLRRTFIIDIHTLGPSAFDTSDRRRRQSLRSILECASIPKVFFDVRSDSDALFNLFNIALAGVVDLQILEYASRKTGLGFVNGLSACIERGLCLSMKQKTICRQIKERGIMLFSPTDGGNYAVFNIRPLPVDIALYCVHDVQWLPALYRRYMRQVPETAFPMVVGATLDRVAKSKNLSYVGCGKHRARGPW